MVSSQNGGCATDFTSVVDLFNQLDKSIRELAKGEMLGLNPISLKVPPTEPPIHTFYTTVSWLYVRVIESGPVHFRFLAERAHAFAIDPNRELQKFRDDLNAFRTVLQHNLNLLDANDLEKLVRFETWMSVVLGRQADRGVRIWPDCEEEWQKLAEALIERAKLFAETNLRAVTHLKNDEFSEDAIRLWILRYNRSLPAHEFENIAAVAAGDLGLQHFDITKLRKAHLDEWNRRLQLLPESVDFRREARRLVENTLLAEAETYMPITGEDIIQVLGIKPGPEVGKALRMARELYRNLNCGRDELLRQLKSALSGQS